MSARPVVVVAYEAGPIREAAVHAVHSAGYQVVEVNDGAAALAALGATPAPAALVVDVGLAGRAGYELCDEIARRGLVTRVVLIASVYSRTAYKRRPTSLYGADDYVEQHHIVDMLASKLARLVPAPVPPPVRNVHDRSTLTDAEVRDGDAIRAAGTARLAADQGLADATERACKLARIIVADLVLYNGTEVEQWLAAGGPGAAERRLPSRVLTDLDEARRLFSLGVPRDVARQRDFVLEALMEFLGNRG